MKMTVPTMLTLARIVMIPVLVLVFYPPYKWTNFAAAFVFAFASATDWLDGWIARRWHQRSRLGQVLDPLADRLYILATLVALTVRDVIPLWFVAALHGLAPQSPATPRPDPT